MTQTQSGGGDDDMVILKKKAIECVEYILFCVLAERKCVVRKADLNKNVIKEYSRSFKAIFDLTKVHMRDTFGLQVIDLDENDKNERFGVRSKFEYDSDLCKLDMGEERKHLRDHVATASAETDREFEEQVKYTVLIIALSLIFMNGNELDDGVFWESMKRVDINKDEKRHKFFGDVYKYFTSELVREGYLEHEQVSVDPPAYKFKWGFRAKLEITKRSVLDFVCEVYGGKDVCKPSEWMSQFADANKVDRFNTVRNADDETDEDNEDAENDDDEESMDSTASQSQARSNRSAFQFSQASQVSRHFR